MYPIEVICIIMIIIITIIIVNIDGIVGAGTGSIVGVDGYGTVMVKNGNENILDEKRKKSNMERLRW